MRNRLVAIAIAVGVVFSGAWACNPQGSNDHSPANPNPGQAQMDAITNALKKCGVNCRVVTFSADLTDQDGHAVSPDEGHEGNITLTSTEIDANGVPQPSKIFDINTGQWVVSPTHLENFPIPMDDVQVLDPSTVTLMTFDVDVFLPSGFTLTCQTEDETRGIVSHDQAENPLPVNVAVGPPVDKHVECAWPGTKLN